MYVINIAGVLYVMDAIQLEQGDNVRFVGTLAQCKLFCSFQCHNQY